MKKIILSTAIAGLLFAACKKDNGQIPEERQDPTEKFGIISFATDSTWVVGHQTWSDAVTATKCQKETFNGGNSDTKVFLADCRSNPGYKGNLFSWEAVNQYQDVLCPDGWRVPTKEDFIALDTAMGGNGTNRSANSTERNRYISTWAGAWGGYCTTAGALTGQGSNLSYWSSTERSSTMAYYLCVSSTTTVNPQYDDVKNYGFALRCVR
jgi:uncharacterized protein (TIGR02145 family)